MRLTRRGRVVTALGVLAGIAGVLLVVGFLYLRSHGLVGASDPGARVSLEVPEGASAADVGRLLEAHGVVASAFGFRLAVLLEGGGEAIQAGEYELRRGLNARDAVAALASGPEQEKGVDVTFPEGSWLTDFARILESETHLDGDRFLRGARSGAVRSRLRPPGIDTLEGLLWPSTYEVGEDETERSLLRRLVAETEKRVRAVGFDHLPVGLTPYEGVVVASMVEAEAKVPAERPKVAAVIYNRLRADMALGIDATVVYAIGRRGATLGPDDLRVDSPYNTRVRTGLPPTPIGAPGEASLEATARPARGEWLYFVVADCAGHHAFSIEYAQFLADKAAYQALEC